MYILPYLYSLSLSLSLSRSLSLSNVYLSICFVYIYTHTISVGFRRPANSSQGAKGFLNLRASHVKGLPTMILGPSDGPSTSA